MKYLLVAVLALIVGAFLARTWIEREEAVDPIQVMVTQLKTHSIVEHERQIAIWYRACPEVIGVNPQIFVAWPGKLSYELPLGDVRIERNGTRLEVSTSAIRADEPAVPTDFLDYLATDALFNFTNEQQLVNDEVRKASAIARYLSAYYLLRDASLYEDFRHEVGALVSRMAGAVDPSVTGIDVVIPEVKQELPKLPKVELCDGSFASVNGLPFVKVEDQFMSPVRFDPARAMQSAGIASVYGAVR
jgi:hypothetical protein